jgi:hypothetical protein
MYGYVAFFGNKRIELLADSLYAAKLAAVKILKPRKSQEHMVVVILAETPNGPVVHHTASL